MSNVSQTYVANRLLRLGDNDTRLPGELIPEAGDWPYRIRAIHLDLEWIKEIPLVSDADRAAVQEQWQEEESRREERRQNAPKVEAAPTEASPPEPPLRWVRCANCREPNAWDEPPDDTERFVCGFCGQPQTVEQARRNVLQLQDPHRYPAYRHGPVVVNHARRNVDLTADFMATLGFGGIPEEGRANEDQTATPG